MITRFVDETATGVSQGPSYKGGDLTPVGLRNHVATEHHPLLSRMRSPVLSERGGSALARGSRYRDSPQATKVMPLGKEPSKPRLTFDARFLNLMIKDRPFRTDRVGKIAQCVWEGASHIWRVIIRRGSTPYLLRRILGRGRGNSTSSRRCVLDGNSLRSSVTHCQRPPGVDLDRWFLFDELQIDHVTHFRGAIQGGSGSGVLGDESVL